MSDTTTTDDAAAQAAFGGGFEDKPAEKTPAKVVKEPAEEKREPEAKTPEYVQLTKDQVSAYDAAMEKLTALEKGQAKAFGTFGKTIDGLQKTIAELRAQTPKGEAVELSGKAYAKLKEQFPELADMTKEAVQEWASSIKGTGAEGDVDSKITQRATEEVNRRELIGLEDEYSNWREIVGAAAKDKVDPNNPYRKWLAGKDQAYQDRINETESPLDIERSIRRFYNDTRKAPVKPTPPPRDNAREAVIRDAVQPRGDGGAPTTSNSREDAFAAGFGS